MNILLICKGEYRYFFPAIAEELRERHGAQVSAVAFSSVAARMLEKTDAFHQVFNLAGWLKARRHMDQASCLETLRNLETQTGFSRINTMIHADRILSNYSGAQIINILAGAATFWESVWNHATSDAVVGEVACATEWMGWLSAEKRNIPYFIPCAAPLAKRMFFLDRPDGMWRAMAETFERLKQRNLWPEEAEAADRFVRSFRMKKLKPPFLQWAQHSPLRPEIARFVRRIPRIPFRVRAYIEDGKFEVGSHHGTPPWKPVWQDLARIGRHALTETAMLAHHFDPRQPNVYFPLHVQPEFTTDVRAPFFANQIALIENISKSVPVGYQVLVKEHPGMKGERWLSYYRRLKKLHNVRLLSPSLDSHKLIQASDAVLTITGSSAWEAILYEKPVIAFGPLYYEFYDLIYKCEDPADLRGVLSQAIERFVPNYELLLKLVWALFQSAHELEWADPVRQPEVTRRVNCVKVADAIVAELTSRGLNRNERAVVA